MSFLAPLWLLVAAAALVVVALHTLRRTQVEVPSVLLWRRLTAVGRARRTLRPPKFSWPLLLQIIIALLIAAALAQPIFGWGAPKPLHRIMVLDSSASMGTSDATDGASRFVAARAALEAEIGRSPSEGEVRISLLVTGAETRFVAARQVERSAVLAALDGLEVSDGAADWTAAAQLLDEVLRSEETNEIAIFSDSADGATALAAARPELSPAVFAFGAEETGNAGVRAQLLPGADDGAPWRLQGEVTLAGDAEPPASVAVLFRPETGRSFLDWGRIALDAVEERDGARVAGFAGDVELPSDGTLLVSLEADSAPFDDVFALVVHEATPLARVLYIGSGNVPLELALRANPGVELFTAQNLPGDAASYDLVVADNVALPQTPQTNLLWVGSGRAADEAAPTLVRDVRPDGWNGEHRLSRGVEWQFIEGTDAYRFAPMAGAATILGTAEGPLIEARTLATGRQMRLALALDGAGWADGPQLPILIDNLIGWIGFGAERAAVEACVAGEVCQLRAGEVGAPIFNAQGEVVLEGLAGSGALPDGVTERFVSGQAGLYTVGDSGRVLAVNAPAGESLIAAEPSGDVATGAQWPLWWWLVGAVVLLLAVEPVLAGRGSEQFLQHEALAKTTPGAMRRRGIVGLRLAVLVLAGLALLSLPLPMPERAEDVVVISGVTADAAERPALLAGLDDRSCGPFGGPAAGLVRLGMRPVVAGDLPCAQVQPGEAGAAGDLEQALILAAAMVRPDAGGRIVVVGDGAETGGSLGRGLPALQRSGIAVDVLPVPRPAPDALIAQVAVPQRIFAGDSFPLTALAESSIAGEVQLQVLADGAVLSEQSVALLAGINRVDVTIPEAALGQHLYQMRVTAPGDVEPGNDVAGAVVEVLPAPRIAIVTPQADWGSYFADALAVQGIEADVLRPDRAPFRLEGWLDYAGVVLMNVPAIDLDTRQQEQLEEMVRVHGRGLMILGGENSFGPGGYFQTPLETVSPLSARVPNDIPAAALAFVLDRSGSMQAPVEGVTRLDIAKQATLSAIELLNDDSQVSVVVFDSLPHVLVPMQERKDVAAVAAALEQLAPGGGTAISPGLEAALDELEGVDSPIKHIVIMSDGLSQPGDFDTLAQRAAEMGATISTVAIGSGADVGRLADLARRGGGAFHETRDFRALPSILSQEAMMLTGEPMELGARNVFWVDRTPVIFEGLPEQLPPIEGYVETTAKPEAVLHLATSNEDGETVPLLASWTHGNGTVLAFASHGAGPGTVQWLALPDYPKLWAQVLRQFAPATTERGLDLALSRHGDVVAIEASLSGPDGAPLPGQAVSLDVERDGAALGLAPVLREMAPGRFAGSFVVDAPGTYRVTGTAGDESADAALHVAYPAALDFSRGNPAALAALAEMTGGRVLAESDPLPPSATRWQWSPAWRPWLVLALVVLLAELALRYAPDLFAFMRRRRPKMQESKSLA